MKRIVLLIISHGATLAIGFALGVFFLPILTAEPAPDAQVLQQQAERSQYSAELSRELRGVDAFHWGEGTISVSSDAISHQGELAPGPDYMVYLTTEFVEHEDEFSPLKANAALIGPVKSFDGFLLDVPEGVDIEEYNTVVVWCETFGEFITAAKYR